jgi:tRNA modification GTPase
MVPFIKTILLWSEGKIINTIIVNPYSTQDTIIALSTPYGMGAIAMIRMSGPESIALTNRFFESKFGKKDLTQMDSHTVHLGYIHDGNQPIDEVLVSIFKNPNSYTGEDLVEISCHGSTYIQHSILQHFVANGVRPAEAGEFTMRAFLNGKMDLSQTEAVADLIHAQSEAAKNVALKQLKGGFSNELSEVKKQLIHFASLIELELDFAEEDVEFADRKQLENLVQKTILHVEQLTKSFQLGNAIKNGINTTIVGRPNAGKSTLLNTLLNEERAIVTEIAGTTRDTLEETIHVKGFLFRFIDTAGLRETEDIVEKIGVAKALEKLHQSDLFIYLFDANVTNLDVLSDDIQNLPTHIPHLIVGNKNDLISLEKKSEINEIDKEIVLISAQLKEDIEILKDKLLEKLALHKIDTSATIITNARHYDALIQVKVSLVEVLRGLKEGMSGDLLSIDLRQALYHLGSITGEITSDDILGNVFANFCIGK